LTQFSRNKNIIGDKRVNMPKDESPNQKIKVGEKYAIIATNGIKIETTNAELESLNAAVKQVINIRITATEGFPFR
jgi:hypothetical protein